MTRRRGIIRERVNYAIERIFEVVEREDLDVITRALLKVFRTSRVEKPSDKWGVFNRLIMFAYGTTDARGVKQWEKVGRRVREGANPIPILIPRLKTVLIIRKDEDGNIETKREKVLVGFLLRDVFAVEDTEGAPLHITRGEIRKDVKEMPELIKELATLTGSSYNLSTIEDQNRSLYEAILTLMKRDGSLGGPEDEAVAELTAAILAYVYCNHRIPLQRTKEYMKESSKLGFIAKLYNIKQLFERTEATFWDIVNEMVKIKKLRLVTSTA
ncbi:MAG: hypothetical protein QXR62_03580 [Candidatus Bathyarchaeia archaeon]